MNLYSYVENPFTPEAFFNFDKFKIHARKGMRIMDDFIDLELEKIEAILTKIELDPEPDNVKTVERELWENIKEKCINGRRTGLGITAEGDMLAALGITYGTDESIDFSELVHKTLKLEAYRESVNLAKERGAFPIYDSNLELNNPFIQRIKDEDPELYADMVKYGRRNIAILTIAPNGSVSILTQTTNGIEPVFMPVYKRRKKVTGFDTKVDFVDSEGQEWTEHIVFHDKFKTYLNVKGYANPETLPYEKIQELLKASPYHKATANDVDWVKKVELQGRVQRNIDHSISVTVNLPNDTTEEMVDKVYKTAWQHGCKGVTVYRDGCRAGVLVSAKDNSKAVKNILEENHAVKRPVELDCDVIRFQNNRESWIGFVGLYEGKPYEIFTGLAEEFEIPKSISKGKIIRKKDNETGTSRYDFEYVDKSGFVTTKQGLSRTFSKEYWNYAKLISGLLRHQVHLPSVINTVNSLNLEDGDSIVSWKAGITRILKKYVSDGSKAGKCSNCGQETLVYQGGCVSCTSCGEGKCG